MYVYLTKCACTAAVTNEHCFVMFQHIFSSYIHLIVTENCVTAPRGSFKMHTHVIYRLLSIVAMVADIEVISKQKEKKKKPG